MGALLSFLVAHSTDIITAIGIIVAAFTHAKVTASSAAQSSTADSLVATVEQYLTSYVTTANVNTTVADLRIELKGQVASLLARFGIYEGTPMRALIDAGVSAAIEAAVGKFVAAHPNPTTLDVRHAAPPTLKSTTFAPAKGT